MDRIEAHRLFFAKLITAQAGVAAGSELASALASSPRERFLSQPPWRVFTRSGYIETPSDDPAFVYQDIVIALRSDGTVNNGQPTLHAACINALAPKKGERVVHIGAGTGYYTSVLARLVGRAGTIDAYEIEIDLAQRAILNLSEFQNVAIHPESGTESVLPACDVLYVNASATEPLAVWLDALNVNGRLLFPLAPEMGSGAMLLITKREDGCFAARFLLQAQFVPCIGAQDEHMTQKLTEAFRNTRWTTVKTLYRNDTPDESCWCSGKGWWLSTAATPAVPL